MLNFVNLLSIFFITCTAVVTQGKDIVSNAPTIIKSLGPDIPRAKSYVPLLDITYCNDDLSYWNCSVCKKAEKLGHKYAGVVNNTVFKTLVLFTINYNTREIVLTFRGTSNTVNTLKDLSIQKVTIEEDNEVIGTLTKTLVLPTEPILVHIGFREAAKSVYSKMVTKLANLIIANPDFTVVLAGHSLGGGMAGIVLYMLQQKINLPPDFPKSLSFAVFTYGEPRVGNKAFADYINAQPIPITRVVNRKDSVPLLPPPFLGFVHHGNEVWILDTEEKICSRDAYEDPECSASVVELEANFLHHLHYWDGDVTECSKDNPALWWGKFVVADN